jgi:hypothetical protein
VVQVLTIVAIQFGKTRTTCAVDMKLISQATTFYSNLSVAYATTSQYLTAIYISANIEICQTPKLPGSSGKLVALRFVVALTMISLTSF